MSVKNTPGIFLIRENTALPEGLALASEPFLPGWRIVRNINVYELSRKIEEAHWNFFYLAGEMKAIIFGHEQSGGLRRAVKQILAKLERRKCNSLEISQVASKTFLGIPFLSVRGYSRHIQKSLFLNPESKVPAAVLPAVVPRLELEKNKPPFPAEVHTREQPAHVSSV
jgi:hypothetical protein